MKDLIEKRLKQLEHYFKESKLLSFDPYDGLNTRVSKFFFGNRMLERVWLQSVRLLPFNIRPLLGIQKIVHTKTVSDLLSGNSILYLKTGDIKYYGEALANFDVLKKLSLRQKHGTAWGLRFKFTTRFVQADENTPNLFQTINALNSLLDYYETLKKAGKDDVSNEVENLLSEGIDFLLNDLGFYESPEIMIWNYWQGLSSPIYNVNALTAGFFARHQKIFDVDTYAKYIRKTFEFLKRRQNEDGSWNYSTDTKGKFIDGFHTGYILEGLSIAKLNGVDFDEEFFKHGVVYYLENFFSANYLIRYFNDETYPIDGQNFAQALQTLFYLKKLNFVESDFINSIFKKTDSVLWNDNGHYNYMKTKLFTYKTAMDRWVNAPMYLALSHLY